MNRINNAVDRFLQEHACSQAILAEYCGLFGLDPEPALRLAAGFAGGMRSGKTCGAVAGAYMVLGLKYGAPGCEKPAGRKNIYDAVCDFTKRFNEVHGTTDCATLLGCNIGTADGMRQAKENNLFQTMCPKFVKSSAEILESMIDNS